MQHAGSQCEGQVCAIHNPSDHHMNQWPTTTRYDRFALVERICTHGVGHPDPDSLAWQRELVERGAIPAGAYAEDHGCDGCCRAPAAPGPWKMGQDDEWTPEVERSVNAAATAVVQWGAGTATMTGSDDQDRPLDVVSVIRLEEHGVEVAFHYRVNAQVLLWGSRPIVGTVAETQEG